MTPEVRDSADGDVPAIREIYAVAVLNEVASFELVPPTVEEMAARRRAVLAGGYPYLVAEIGGRVLGFAYANQYRTRPAYRYAVENTIYVAPEAKGKGIGRVLLGRLIEECEARGFRQMVAVIGDSANQASIGLHAALGFGRIGTLKAIGFKHGRWVDSVLMQRSLGVGDAGIP